MQFDVTMLIGRPRDAGRTELYKLHNGINFCVQLNKFELYRPMTE